MIDFDRFFGVLLVVAFFLLSPCAWADERDSLVDDFSGAPESFLDVDPALTDGKAFVYQVRGDKHISQKKVTLKKP